MTDRLYPPIHPDEILQEDFLDGFGITSTSWPCPSGAPRRSNEIVHGKRRISADTALRLDHSFATDPQFWINLQARYDLEFEKDARGLLDSIQPLRTA